MSRIHRYELILPWHSYLKASKLRSAITKGPHEVHLFRAFALTPVSLTIYFAISSSVVTYCRRHVVPSVCHQILNEHTRHKYDKINELHTLLSMGNLGSTFVIVIVVNDGTLH